MKKKRWIWIFAAVLAIAAVQGTAFAEEQEFKTSAEAITEATETEKIPETEVLIETAKEQISDEKQEQPEIKKTADGQTLLDVSKGNITITSAGATGGGYKQ